MSKMGRPSKVDPNLTQQIADLVRVGNYIETACQFVGVAKSTLYDWLKRGAKGEEGYVDFSNAIQQAFAESEIRDVMNLQNASKTDWKVSAWRLERKFPSRWGRMDRLEVESNNTTKIDVVQQTQEQILNDVESLELAKQIYTRQANLIE